MEPVKLATRPLPSTEMADRLPSTSRGARIELGDAPWLRFGDDLVYVGREKDWAGLAAATSRAGVVLREHPDLIDRARLHVIIQKGRLFQREHPDVGVLVDKGRYLLVDLDPSLARNLSKKKEPCYSVRALEALDADGEPGENRVVFETRSRGADRAVARAVDPAVQALVDRISRPTLEANLAQLVGLPTRLSTSTHYRRACDFVEQQLQSLGYTTSRQTISVNGAASANVIARRAGTGPAPRGAVLVTAHLDSVNHEGTAGSPAPGADDDGSGSAGVLEIARVLKEQVSVHDFVFILFGGEEQGLLGSRHFVRSMSAAQRSKLRAVVTMDMIGTLNSPAPTVLLEGRTLAQDMLDRLAAAASTYTSLTVETSVNAANSDHVSFLDKGIPAVLTIEGADSSNHEIHTARDTLDRINFDLALEILRMNTAFTAEALAAV